MIIVSTGNSGKFVLVTFSEKEPFTKFAKIIPRAIFQNVIRENKFPRKFVPAEISHRENMRSKVS